MRRDKFFRLAALAGVAALVTTGCLSSSDEGSTSSSGDGDTAGAGGSDPGDGVVEISGAFSGAEQEGFEKALVSFEEESGVDIEYTGNSDFTTFIRTSVQGDPPDIALFPQPGLLLEIASDAGTVVPIDEFLDAGALEETLIPSLDSNTDSEGVIFGAPMRMAVKSLVWVPKAYAEEGYSLEPATVQELEDIAGEIKASGTPPWCIAYESGAATGWVGTDWIEEFVLRTSGPDVYDQWVSHEIPFDAPEIQEAFDAYGELIGPDADNVRGGVDGILSTPFGEAGNSSFDTPPECYMQRQGNFIAGFFPADVQKDLDANVDVFVFPPYEGGYDGQPILGGGDIAALFNGEDQESKDVMEFLTNDQFGAEWAAIGGWLSPHRTFDASNYPDETTRKIAKIAADADVFRYDASDLMPPEVGADSFWKGSVAWVDGSQSTEEVTADIEASWPTS
ncbi:MAG: carbohydrate ABC transporter substrate-binding protein [Nocardioidaceae bacterium]|nr:carbohydrate ABC transporter substrate-binding protein [Nocardioidaceae bacterium]